MTKDEARELLKSRKLRTTAPRVAVVMALAEAKTPITYSGMLERLGSKDWDPATIFRNLVKLTESGIASIVDRVDGRDRYTLRTEGETHRHPHFVCEACGMVACLPATLGEKLAIEGRWADSVRQAVLQLRGACPDCRDTP